MLALNLTHLDNSQETWVSRGERQGDQEILKRLFVLHSNSDKCAVCHGPIFLTVRRRDLYTLTTSLKGN